MKNKIAEVCISYRPRKVFSNLKVTCSKTAYTVLLENWNQNTIELFEEFKVLLLNNSNQVLGIYTVSKGGFTATIVDLRHLFSVILKSGCTSFITSHNHPSGKLKPSNSDSIIHSKIKKIAEFHEVSFLDNIIITKDGWYSFTDSFR